jgi:hypothetical protein
VSRGMNWDRVQRETRDRKHEDTARERQRRDALPLKPDPYFRAKYRGKCALCPEAIEPGERVTRWSGKGYAHFACLPEPG